MKKNSKSKKSEGPSKSEVLSQKSLQLGNETMLLGREAEVGAIIEFLESFQDLMNPQHRQPLKLISIKIPVALLEAFRFKAERAGIPYQTQIKKLMTEWLKVG